MKDCTRRTFMKTSLAAVGSVALASSAWSQIRGANDDIRIAIVGVRKKGKEHIQDFRRLSGVRVVAICDADTKFLDIEVAKFKERKMKVDTYVDYRKLLENKNIDAVVLSVPDHLHALMTVWACRNLTDLAMLESLETEKNKQVFFATQEFPQNAAGRLSVGVMGVVARWYTDNLREEVNKGFRSKVEAGEYPHRPPYGYRPVKESKGSKLPTPDPEKTEVVRTIFKLTAFGGTFLATLPIFAIITNSYTIKLCFGHTPKLSLFSTYELSVEM